MYYKHRRQINYQVYYSRISDNHRWFEMPKFKAVLTVQSCILGENQFQCEAIIKLTYHVKPRGTFSISSRTIRLISANQKFDTENICVENWLTICNNLLMDHQQHYWYIKNSNRALQNTNNSISVLNTRHDWPDFDAVRYWSARRYVIISRQFVVAECDFLVVAACRVNLTRWEPISGLRFGIFITTQFQGKWGG